MARVEAELLKCPEGATSLTLGKATGYATSSAAKGLGDLAKVGKALHMRGAYGKSTWFHVKHKAQMWARIDAQKAALAESTQSRLRTEERYARFLSFEDDPVHRIIPANLARPIRPAGPASVWGLAA